MNAVLSSRRAPPAVDDERAQHSRKVGRVSRHNSIEWLTSAPRKRRVTDVWDVAVEEFVTALCTLLLYVQCTLFGTMCIDCGEASRHGHGNNRKCVLVRQLVDTDIRRCAYAVQCSPSQLLLPMFTTSRKLLHRASFKIINY